MQVSARLVAAALAATLAAQDPDPNGPRQIDAGWHALVHATAITAPGEQLDDATIVFRDGRIVSVQPGGTPPAGARIWDCTGRTVLAGFIEPHLAIPLPAPPAGPDTHWHPLVTPQRRALDGAGIDEKTRKELRKLGFTAAAIAPEGGSLRGSAAVVLLEDPAPTQGGHRARVVRDDVWQVAAFATSDERSYPRSLMGAIALVRQALVDGAWAEQLAGVERKTGQPAPPHARAALAPLAGRPRLLFDVRDEHEALAAARVAREAEHQLVLLGSGREFRRLAAIAAAGVPVVVPLDFPRAPPVQTLQEADAVPLEELLTWEQAPTNPRRLLRAGVPIALTSGKLEKRGEFRANLRRAIAHGLTHDEALAALTTKPAALLGIEDHAGTIAPGKLANLLVVEGDWFGKDGKLRMVWVGGRLHDLDERHGRELDGSWALRIETEPPLELAATLDAKNELDCGKEWKAAHVRRDDGALQFVLTGKALGDGSWRFEGRLLGAGLRGRAVDPTGRVLRWSAARTGDADTGADAQAKAADAAAEAEEPAEVPQSLTTPLGPYGLSAPPAMEDVVVTGATVWTSGPAGIVADGVLAVRDGKIVYVGPRQDAPEIPGARVLDASGKHVTPGLIDCHSHTGIVRGVNEGTDAVTSEVRIGDVVDADDVGWYRELAGGLTAANQLHGSANPIGGQNSVVKLRWGVVDPQQMRIRGAPEGIKFALGENVKRSNSRQSSDRYPATRMGVEALLIDRFTAAREYAARHAAHGALGDEQRGHAFPPRRDLRLEGLAEVLAGTRLVHCHSYRQDEILMLARVAQEFGFQVGTFQHVLEGYKVADAIAASALGASSFSDWWAYKFEVYDGIPHNGALMHARGVVVSFNSDSAELARRLNTEAAKAVRYGGLDPAVALQFVTRNPAIQLGIADRTGSLEVGKDADFVIWSADPLSTRAVCEQTWIDGRPMFTRERDRALRARDAGERQRIVQKLLAQKPRKADGAKDATEEQGPRDPKQVMAELARALAEEARRQRAPVRGECGCEEELLWR